MQIALVALGALMGILWWMGHSPSPRFVKRDSSRRVARASLLVRSQAASSGKVFPLWLLEPGVAERRIAGTVVFDGQPVAGTWVELRSEYLSLSGTKPPGATTDVHGRFDLGEHAATVYALMALAEGFRPGGVRVDLRNPASDPLPDRVVIELSKCETWIFGEVIDTYGELVVEGTLGVASKLDDGAWYEELYSVPIRDDGTFSLCRPKEHQQLFVTAVGYGTVWLRDQMPLDGYRVRLFPEGIVNGKVVDEHGAAIEGARVVILGSLSLAGGLQAPPAQTVMSLSDGSFRVVGVTPGDYEVAADHGLYAMYSKGPNVAVAAGEEATGIVLQMRRCRSLAGLVLSEGQPVVGVSVGPRYQAITQSDGSFFMGCVSSEASEFKVEGYDVLESTIPGGLESIDDLIVEASPRSSISGQITADGEPVKNAIVAVGDPSGLVGLRSVFGESYRATTSTEGRYELKGVPSGSHEINAWDPVTQRRSKPTVIIATNHSRAEGVNLALENASGVAGTVVDPEGTPVPNVEIHLSGGQPPSGQPLLVRFSGDYFAGKTDENGRFRIGGLTVGSYKMCLGRCYYNKSDPRYLPEDHDSWADVEVKDDDQDTELHLVIRSRVGLSISGRVLYHDRTPVSFAVVRTSVGDGHATTDENGTFLISGTSEGQYKLSVLAQDGSRGDVKGVAAGSDSVEIIVPRVGSLVGTVVGGSGQCTITVSMKVEPAVGIIMRRGRSYSATGTRDFSFSAVQPGEYRIESECDGGVASTRAVVSSGNVTKVELEVGEAGTIRGTVKLFPGGQPVPNVRCQSGRATNKTNSSGEFELNGILPGDVRVTCGDWGGTRFSPGFVEVSVPVGGVVEAEVFIVEAAMPGDSSRVPSTEQLLGANLELTKIGEGSALTLTRLVSGGPAALAGVEDGDILIGVADVSATGSNSAAAALYVASRPAGSSIQFTIRRDEMELQISLVLGGLPPGGKP